MPLRVYTGKGAMKRLRGPKATAKDVQQDKKIAKIAKIVNSRELHFFDQSVSTVVPNWGGAMTSLVRPAVGDTDLTRTGDKIYIEKIELRLNLFASGAGNATTRFILFRDKGNAMVSNAVLDTTYQGTPNFINTPYDMDFFNKMYTVLYDKTLAVDSVSNAIDIIKISKKVQRQCSYIDGTTSPTSGELWLWYCSSQATPNVFFNMVSRTYYSDL